MSEPVKIGPKDSHGMDEWYCTWYCCPECNGIGGKNRDNRLTSHESARIYHDFSFCPDCGKPLEWQMAEEDEYLPKATCPYCHTFSIPSGVIQDDYSLIYFCDNCRAQVTFPPVEETDHEA
jgi:hypothetical protein